MLLEQELRKFCSCCSFLAVWRLDGIQREQWGIGAFLLTFRKGFLIYICQNNIFYKLILASPDKTHNLNLHNLGTVIYCNDWKNPWRVDFSVESLQLILDIPLILSKSVFRPRARDRGQKLMPKFIIIIFDINTVRQSNSHVWAHSMSNMKS